MARASAPWKSDELAGAQSQRSGAIPIVQQCAHGRVKPRHRHPDGLSADANSVNDDSSLKEFFAVSPDAITKLKKLREGVSARANDQWTGHQASQAGCVSFCVASEANHHHLTGVLEPDATELVGEGLSVQTHDPDVVLRPRWVGRRVRRPAMISPGTATDRRSHVSTFACRLAPRARLPGPGRLRSRLRAGLVDGLLNSNASTPGLSATQATGVRRPVFAAMSCCGPNNGF